MSTVALITIVHGRHDHLANQAVSVRDGTRHPDLWVVVAMNDPTLTVAGACVLHLDTDLPGLPLAAARNLGARHAISLGADVLVFLDVDCLPGPRLVEASAAAVDDAPDVVWSGVVTYLPPPPDRGYALTDLQTLDAPHPGRPAPDAGERLDNPDPDLFWSLCFALHRHTWQRIGGFCEEYVGYGGEDTDFARVVHERGFRHGWLGDARPYHQHHEIESPPVRHVDAIVRNAAIFHDRWGVWPMTTWLNAFAELGLVECHDGRWHRTQARDVPAVPERQTPGTTSRAQPRSGHV